MFNVFSEATGGASDYFMILLPIGLLILVGKGLALLLGKFKIPQVIGFLLGGILVGLLYLIPGKPILYDFTINGIQDLAKIGVVLILFSAGLGTDLKQIKAQGVSSVIITSLGVIVPLALGFLVSWLCLDINLSDPLQDVYYGVILTATSVSITVATLKELGHLNGKVGTALTAAAILDDIIGVILLSVIIALKKASTGEAGAAISCGVFSLNTGSSAWNIVLLILIMASFFAISIGIGILVHKAFDWMGKKWPHHQRIPMFSLAFCFIWAFVAEYVFGIADITGAYIAGLILANTSAQSYIAKRTDQMSNIIFEPIFFGSVGISMVTSLADSGGSFEVSFIIFGLVWVVAGLLGKIIGAGSGALICRFKFKESIIIGIGMMARAEVLIVTAQKGVSSGLVSQNIIPFTLLLILVSSFLTPILLKTLYKGEPREDVAISRPTTPPAEPANK